MDILLMLKSTPEGEQTLQKVTESFRHPDHRIEFDDHFMVIWEKVFHSTSVSLVSSVVSEPTLISIEVATEQDEIVPTDGSSSADAEEVRPVALQ